MRTYQSLSHGALRMCFRTAPHPVPQLSTFQNAAGRNVRRVFQISELNPIDLHFILLHVNEDVIRFDICSVLINNELLMQRDIVVPL